jgi:hypothetical protein
VLNDPADTALSTMSIRADTVFDLTSQSSAMAGMTSAENAKTMDVIIVFIMNSLVFGFLLRSPDWAYIYVFAKNLKLASEN